jgi:uncharacterized protein YegJ (DUF2314 family)
MAPLAPTGEPNMGLWSWIKGLFGKGDKGDEENKPLIALVLLLREPRYLDAEIVARLASTAWGKKIGTDTSEETDGFVAGESPSFILHFEKFFFLVNNFSMAYVDDPDAAARDMADLRLANAMREHRAWLSVDMLGEAEGEELAEAYGYIGKLLAALADTDCLAIYSPATTRLNVYDAALEEQLRGPDPLKVFAEPTFVPVINVPDDDPRMEAAVKEARERWPEFVAAFEARQEGQHFAVKSRFSEGEEVEWMWTGVTAIEQDHVLGLLDNDPVSLKKVKSGSRVRVAIADLGDWMYTRGEELQGGFTVKVVAEAAQKKQEAPQDERP